MTSGRLSPSIDPEKAVALHLEWNAKQDPESATVRKLMESVITRVKALAKDRARVRKYDADKKRAHYQAKRDKILADRKSHYRKNHKQVRARQAKYRNGPLYALLDKDKTRAKQTVYVRNRRRNDPVVRIANNTRRRIHDALRTAIGDKSAHTIDILGCSFQQLTLHLEQQLDNGEELGDMEMDHIFPVSAYDLTQPEQQLSAFGFRNTQPLTRRENREKLAKMPTKAMGAKVPLNQWPPGVTMHDLPNIYPGWKTALRKD